MTDTTFDPAREAELLERARAGDQHAFADLVTPYRNRTWAVCLRMTDSQFDAEDALQEALTAAWKNLQRFRGGARFGTWLYRIAVNAANAVLRKRRVVRGDRRTPEDPGPEGEVAAERGTQAGGRGAARRPERRVTRPAYADPSIPLRARPEAQIRAMGGICASAHPSNSGLVGQNR